MKERVTKIDIFQGVGPICVYVKNINFFYFAQKSNETNVNAN